MKRGLGSLGLMSTQLRPPSVEVAMSRPVYSVMTLSLFFGSTSVSPPSPPNGSEASSGENFEAPGVSFDVPLSCRPPQ